MFNPFVNNSPLLRIIPLVHGTTKTSGAQHGPYLNLNPRHFRLLITICLIKIKDVTTLMATIPKYATQKICCGTKCLRLFICDIKKLYNQIMFLYLPAPPSPNNTFIVQTNLIKSSLTATDVPYRQHHRVVFTS